MKVILKQNIKGVGNAGEVKEVSDGYARNYLFPRNLAVIADAGALKKLAQQRHRRPTGPSGDQSGPAQDPPG
jgi:large subunit ribosomal protein L9